MITNLQAIVLAAGKSTRFNTGKTKLVEKICGQAMILYVTRLLEGLKIPTTAVVGYQKDSIEQTITQQHNTISFAYQEEQLGTGHAILCSQATWKQDNILIMNGDIPLVTEEIITHLWETHLQTGAMISFVTAHNSDRRAETYGRVVENDGRIEIIEADEFEGELHDHGFVNAEIYIVKKTFLEAHTGDLKQRHFNDEFYITDLVRIASKQHSTVATTRAPFDVIRGINTLEDLWAAEQIKRAEMIRHWMTNGVRFFTAQNAHIDLNVTIGNGTFIGAGVHLLGNTTIGSNCRIEAFTIIEDAIVQDNAHIHSHSIIKNSAVEEWAEVGPYAHVHKNSTIKHHACIGNFVEVARSIVGSHTKAKHLTYLGDATIGERTNIGAGTITCNYDGKNKHKTVIGDNSFIGTNNSLVAPITIGNNAFTAAGSTITKDVPSDALAIARAYQTNKEGYAHKIHAQSNDEDKNKNSSPKGKFSFFGAIKTENDTPNLE